MLFFGTLPWPAGRRSVCLLDEATSALDVRTERALAEAMAELMKGRGGVGRRGAPGLGPGDGRFSGGFHGKTM